MLLECIFNVSPS